MKPKKSLILCSTLRDTNGELLLALRKSASLIKQKYGQWVISATADTDERVIEALKKEGFIMVLGEEKLSPDSIENAHLLALKGGQKWLGDGQYLQYTDGDRIIFGAAYFPEEFSTTVEKVEKMLPGSDYISLTRNEHDHASHHAALVETEKCLTRVYQEALDAPVDPAGTAHVFSREACKFVLDNSNNHGVMKFPHGKWAVLAKEGGFKIDCLETSQILSFETPLQFGESFKADAFIGGSHPGEAAEETRKAHQEERLPSLEALREYFFTLRADQVNSREEWQRRINLAEEWISFVDKEMDSLNIPDVHQEGLKESIKKELAGLAELKRERLNENGKETKFR